MEWPERWVSQKVAPLEMGSLRGGSGPLRCLCAPLGAGAGTGSPTGPTSPPAALGLAPGQRVRRDWFTKQCSQLFTNQDSIWPQAPSSVPPLPPPPHPVPVCGLWGWPRGTGLGRRLEGLSRGRAGTRVGAGPRAAPPGPGWLWRCGWARRPPPECPAARAPQSAWSRAGPQVGGARRDLLTRTCSWRVMF